MESRAALLESAGSDGRYRLSGVLNFETVPALLNDSMNLFPTAGPEIEVDLSAVTASNSAGLGLLLEWVRQTRLASQTIRFHNIPPGMTAVAKASDLDGVIPGLA